MKTETVRFKPYVFEPWSHQTIDLKSSTCYYLVWHSALLGQDKEQWNEEDQSTMIEISPA